MKVRESAAILSYFGILENIWS